jgi:hypothetical protein
MLEIFQQMEAAIQQAAVAQGVKLPPETFPPYPEFVDRMSINELRQYLLTKRRLRRPPGTADLTEPVLALLNRQSPPPASAPATSPSSAPSSR